MVHHLRDDGVSMGDAYIILVDADKRWGKYHERADCVEQLTKIIEDCYGLQNSVEFSP
jgi:hypothetical protein